MKRYTAQTVGLNMSPRAEPQADNYTDLMEDSAMDETRYQQCLKDEHYAEAWEDDMKQEAPFE